MIIQTYNSAGGADYSNLTTFGSDLTASTVSDFDADLTVLLKVEEGIHDAEPMYINGFTTSGVNLIISGEVPLEGSGTGNGAVYRQSHTAALHIIYDGYSLSSLQVENIEFDLVSAARNYGTPVLGDFFGNGEQLDKIITFKNCRFHSLSSGPTAGCYMVRLQPASATGHAYTYTFNFENCLFHDFDDSTAGSVVNRFTGRNGTLNINWKGCVAIGSATRVSEDLHWGADATFYYNKKFEGCIFTEQPTQYPGGPGNIGVSAIDCISDNSCWDLTSISNTNVSSNITVNLSGAPASDEVSFISGSTGDFRLYDDSNNLAIEFVSNSTLPTPDFQGNDRGTSPYDAGAIAIVDEDFQFGETVAVIQVGYRRSNNRINIGGGE